MVADLLTDTPSTSWRILEEYNLRLTFIELDNNLT